MEINMANWDSILAAQYNPLPYTNPMYSAQPLAMPVTNRNPMYGAAPLSMPVTPRASGGTLDTYRNPSYTSNGTYVPSSGYGAYAGGGSASGGNSPAAYTPRSNAPSANYQQPSYNNYGPTNYSNGVGAMAGQIAAGMNMSGGGTNLYGGQGAAVVPGNGVIYNGGGGQQSSGLGQQLLSEVQRAHNEGKAANEKRYSDVLDGDSAGASGAMMDWLKSKYKGATQKFLDSAMSNPQYQALFDKDNPGVRDSFGGYRDRYARGMGYLQGQGEQAKKDINQSYDNLNSSQQQNLASRGLLNSTISGSMQTGVERKRQDSLNTQRESTNRQYLDTDSRLSKDTLDFQERRQDTYPSMAEYTQLAMQLGNSGMIGGGYNGGYGQQTGVGTMMNGAPMVYGGQQITSAYGVNNTRGLNSTSGYAPRW
jgi:hypothetical protein